MLYFSVTMTYDCTYMFIIREKNDDCEMSDDGIDVLVVVTRKFSSFFIHVERKTTLFYLFDILF